MDEAEGALTFKTAEIQNSNGSLNDFDALILSTHHVVPRDSDLPFEKLGPKWGSLIDFYGCSLQAKLARDLGHMEGDLGATEIARGLLLSIRELGLNGLLVYPSLGGRLGVDWNRKPGNTMFAMPPKIKEAHLAYHQNGILVLNKVIDAISGNVKVVLQPHTMASGEFEREKRDSCLNTLQTLDPNSPAYLENLDQAVKKMLEINNHACNQSTPRPGVCLVTGYENLPPFSDAGLNRKLLEAFQGISILGEFNKPYHHGQGYTCSTVIEKLIANRKRLGLADVPQATFDISKFHITSDRPFDALETKLDVYKVNSIVHAIAKAIKNVVHCTFR